jgi:tripartite-type tricarboxylate transporter receptor subunit TctC
MYRRLKGVLAIAGLVLAGLVLAGLVLAGLVPAGLALAPVPANATDYPSRLITLIAPWPPAGAIDTLC